MNKFYYLDDDNNIVNEERATHFIIQEYDNNGTFIKETFGYINADESNKKDNMDIKYSNEEKEFLDSFVDRHGNHPFRK